MKKYLIVIEMYNRISKKHRVNIKEIEANTVNDVTAEADKMFEISNNTYCGTIYEYSVCDDETGFVPIMTREKHETMYTKSCSPFAKFFTAKTADEIRQSHNKRNEIYAD